MSGWEVIGWSLVAAIVIVILSFAVAMGILIINSARDQKVTTKPKESVNILSKHEQNY